MTDINYGSSIPTDPTFIIYEVLPTEIKQDKKEINDLYETKEEFDNEGNWKGYKIAVKDTGRILNPIKPYNVPINYDQNKELDKVKSINGLQ